MRHLALVFSIAGALGAMGTAAAIAAADTHRTVDDWQPDGKPLSCIQQSQVRDTRVLDDGTIDFVMSGRRVYRNHLPQPCPELGFEKSFIHATPTDNYCSGDLITVFRHDVPGIPGATCGLGEFQPMARAQAAR